MREEEKQSFDGLALSYDDVFSKSFSGKAQRKMVHKYLSGILPELSGNAILELGCGTGEDAMFLSSKGCAVLAIDASKEMIEIAKTKCRNLQNINFMHLPMQKLVEVEGEKKFDLIFSNFGAFNCLSPEELKLMSIEINRLLKPEGHFISVIMGRFCLWESLYFLSKFSIKKAFRRKIKKALSVPIGNNQFIDTWYYNSQEFFNAFSNHSQLVARLPIGTFIPPSYLSPWFENKSFVKKVLVQMENWSSRMSLSSKISDHILVHLQKTKRQ